MSLVCVAVAIAVLLLLRGGRHERKSAILQQAGPRLRHRTRDHLLKQLVIFAFLIRARITGVSLEVDLRHGLAAKWTVLILGEPLFNALLVEEVLCGVTGHSYDFALQNENLAADKTLLHRFAEVSRVVWLCIFSQVHVETAIAEWSEETLTARADRMKTMDHIRVHGIAHFLPYFMSLARHEAQGCDY